MSHYIEPLTLQGYDAFLSNDIIKLIIYIIKLIIYIDGDQCVNQLSNLDWMMNKIPFIHVFVTFSPLSNFSLNLLSKHG